MKPPLIGQDADWNEYWIFKEDLSKVYVKFSSTKTWGVYEDESAINQLE